jgi:hypothetical protein
MGFVGDVLGTPMALAAITGGVLPTAARRGDSARSGRGSEATDLPSFFGPRLERDHFRLKHIRRV